MKTLTTSFGVLITLMLFGTTSCFSQRPNILMVMVDDLGFSDLGCYGGEIETPNLDSLAESGLRFSQFYNTAKCHSSRVSLLTGQYCIAAGDTALSHAVTTPEVLSGAGYHTAMTGKWHLKGQPTEFGFRRYFGHLSGVCNYFRGDGTFRLNGKPFDVPEQDFYTTVANVDYALEFLSDARRADADADHPWHLYIAFNAPHAPLQALPEDYAKYEGRYDAGWDVVRERRLGKQRSLGLLGNDVRPSPRPEHIPPWNELSQPRKEFEVKRMTALAAMIDRVDQEIGRLIQDLKSNGELENTLIWFVSDNGACPYDRRSNKIDALPTDASVSWSDSTGWAWARNSPFRYYKQNQFEGGICTPAIAHWPKGIRVEQGSIVREAAHLIDLLPTFADVADANIPTEFGDRELRPVSGQSLLPILTGDEFERKNPLHFLFSTDRGLRQGDWKIVSFRGEAWELYNIANDRTELEDLAIQDPDRVADMVRSWESMARDLLHAPTRSYQKVSAEQLPHTHREWTDFSIDPKQGVQDRRPKKTSGSQPKQRKGRAKPIRARKNTKLRIDGRRLVLQYSGDDPGLAFDRLPESIPSGPYTLVFKAQSRSAGSGEVFFTTDPTTQLPKGQRIPFDVSHDGRWQEFRIPLDSDQKLHKLRLDVGDEKGSVTIDELQLQDASGNAVISWPEPQTPPE